VLSPVEDITAQAHAEAMLTVLRMAEFTESWDLYKEALKFIQEAGAHLSRLDRYTYAIEF
jgi:hypothetical protein